MTPAAKLIASCDGDAATAQAIVLDELLAALGPFGLTPDEAAQAETNLRQNIRLHTPEGAVQYLLDIRERTKKQMEGAGVNV